MHIVILTQHTFPGGVIDTRRYLDPLSKSLTDLGAVGVEVSHDFDAVPNCGSWEYKDMKRVMHALVDKKDRNGLFVVVPDMTRAAQEQVLSDLGYGESKPAGAKEAEAILDAIGDIESALGQQDCGGVGHGSSIANWQVGDHYTVIHYPDVCRCQMEDLVGRFVH